MVGTSFLIGNNGFALSAAHVIDQCFKGLSADEVVLALFWTNGWHVKEVVASDTHPTEDVGIIKLNGNSWASILEINDYPQNSSCEYQCWGYPHDVAQEPKELKPEALEKPVIIFSQGYVRRRVSNLLPVSIVPGNQFYELSEQAGQGNSGAPIILKNSIGQLKWKFFGIYNAERRNISYAVRAEAFSNWKPNILDKTIKEESLLII